MTFLPHNFYSDLQHHQPDDTHLLQQFLDTCCLGNYCMRFSGRKTTDKSFNLTRLAEFILRQNGQREPSAFSMVSQINKI